LPLPEPVAAAFHAFHAAQATERLAAGVAYAGSGYVLVDELGAPFRTDQLRRAGYRLMREAGVRQVRLYDARHACLTYLSVSGVPAPIVGACAGHADLSMAPEIRGLFGAMRDGPRPQNPRICWSGWRDSNPRPLAPKRYAELSASPCRPIHGACVHPQSSQSPRFQQPWRIP
jgi:hypothetical protein